MRNSKSGLYFCSKKCKDFAQSFESDLNIKPSHYKNGERLDKKHYYIMAKSV
jgi:hypothetical protein